MIEESKGILLDTPLAGFLWWVTVNIPVRVFGLLRFKKFYFNMPREPRPKICETIGLGLPFWTSLGFDHIKGTAFEALERENSLKYSLFTCVFKVMYELNRAKKVDLQRLSWPSFPVAFSMISSKHRSWVLTIYLKPLNLQLNTGRFNPPRCLLPELE